MNCRNRGDRRICPPQHFSLPTLGKIVLITSILTKIHTRTYVTLSRCHQRRTVSIGSVGAWLYVCGAQCSLADSSAIPFHGQQSIWREAAREAGVLAERYESACLFIMVDHKRQAPCATNAPLWNNGVNHIMIDFNDYSR